MRRAHADWKSLPGNWDPLHARDAVPGIGTWDLPELAAVAPADVPEQFAAYDALSRLQRRGTLPARAGVHFFTDDYRFESAWNDPARALAKMVGCAAACSPDFSLYRDWPIAMQLWNVYRSRLLGALWSRAMPVIPTVGWSDARSYAFAFDGLPRESVLAVSTVGTQGPDKTAAALFVAGYESMIEALRPTLVLVHGERVPAEVEQLAPIRRIPTWQQSMRRRAEPRRPAALST